MSRLYVYKIRYDDGTAPCVEDGLLSLALCKPAIRATAEVGDTLVAFAAKSMCPDQRLVYAAVVSRRLVDGAYYREVAWRRRRDCIYAWSGGAFRRGATRVSTRPDADLVHDLGDALTRSRTCWSATTSATPTCDLRSRRVSGDRRNLALLGQGHRLNHGERVHDALDRYLARDVVGILLAAERSAVPPRDIEPARRSVSAPRNAADG